ncbi:MAG: FAD-dependent oxidoreductase [Phycisphaeraceae bacterium]|nr:FAD-dependent oxidoreductase [Phycisphaeraceae bacterium]MCW5754742.1 FAD-dependent oxidoreductase [Phycisphaeraceae bacterium]
MSRSLFVRLAERFGPRERILARREFLRGAAIAAAGLAAGCTSSSPRKPLPPMSPLVPETTLGRVLIVGGGFAGLACAFELLRAGADPIVLEPRNRVGGRVLSLNDRIPGKTIEAGGEFIGANHPTWLGYAQRFGLALREATEEDLDLPFVLGGESLTASESEELYELLDMAVSPLTALAQPIDPTRPWESPGARELDARSVGDWLTRSNMPNRVRHALGAMFAADNGVAIERQNLLALLSMIKGGGLEDYWTQSEVYRCEGGNQLMAERLAEALGPTRVRLGVRVVMIDATHPQPTIRTERGDLLQADAVVLAVPPSAWPGIELRLPLPAGFSPQMGLAIKHISLLDKPHWRTLGYSPDAFTDSDVSLTWHATDGQPGEHGYAMTAFSGGPAAERVLARPEGIRRERQRDDLEALYPGIGKATTSEMFIDWPGDPLVRAGYSFPGLGEIFKYGPTLVNGLGRVQFAGEHCSYGFVGYMEGALGSGVRVAHRLVGVS